MSFSFSVDKPTTPCSLQHAAGIRDKKLWTWFFESHSDLVNRRSLDSFFAFRMSAATWPGSALRPVLSPIVKRAVRYSLTFGENLTLLLGLLKAQPACRDDFLKWLLKTLAVPWKALNTFRCQQGYLQMRISVPSPFWWHHTGLTCWQYVYRHQDAALTAQRIQRPRCNRALNIQTVVYYSQYSC